MKGIHFSLGFFLILLAGYLLGKFFPSVFANIPGVNKIPGLGS